MGNERSKRERGEGPDKDGRLRMSVELLEQHHDFPCLYMFKVIGFCHDDFVEEVRAAVEPVLGRLTEGEELRLRPSRGGRYLSVTLEKEVADAGQVLAVYQALKGLQGLVALI